MGFAKQRTFKYVKLEKAGRRYFCLDQNVFAMAWLLFLNRGPLRYVGWSEAKSFSLRLAIRWLRGSYRSFRRNLSLFKKFVLLKYRAMGDASAIHLPIYGQLCAPVHQGYKIFDLRRAVVRKVFDNGVNTSVIADEIELLKNISQLDCATSIKRWNLNERWYEEDYISGPPDDPQVPPNSQTLLNRFSVDLIQHLISLIQFQKAILKPAVDYVTDIINLLEASRLSCRGSIEREYSATKHILCSMVERLRVEGNCPIFLVFAHGDFCPANMLITKRGVRLVDWEGAGYRSVLFDFYSYFFYGFVIHKVPISKIAAEIDRALPLFMAHLANTAPQIHNSVSDGEKIYRCIYYVERLCQEVQRAMTDKRTNMMDFVLGYSRAFDRYDKIIAADERVVCRV